MGIAPDNLRNCNTMGTHETNSSRGARAASEGRALPPRGLDGAFGGVPIGLRGEKKSLLNVSSFVSIY